MRYALEHCKVTEVYEPRHEYVFEGPCVVTGKLHQVAVPANGLFRYHHGALIQDAFPEIPADDREFLTSGMSPEGFSIVFGQEFDEEEEEEDEVTAEIA